MGRRSRNELQTKRDVRRAEALLATQRGLSRDEGVQALKDDAASTGVSLHAAALAVLSADPGT